MIRWDKSRYSQPPEILRCLIFWLKHLITLLLLICTYLYNFCLIQRQKISCLWICVFLFQALTCRNNGALYIHDILDGRVLCQVKVPEPYELLNPWEPTVTIGAMGQMLYIKGATVQGWGLLRQVPPIRYFPNFSVWSKHTLAIEYNVYIWQVWQHLSNMNVI